MSQLIQTKIVEKKHLTPDVIELVLQPSEKLNYTEGQFVNLKIPTSDGKINFRAYSIANHPKDKETGILRFVIKLLDGGVAGQYLKDKKVGDSLEIMKPTGLFQFKSHNVSNVYMICTGTGITPLLSMIENELNQHSTTNFQLFFGLRFDTDIFWQDILENLKKTYSNFDFQITLSQPSQDWQGNKGYVTELVKNYPLDWQEGHFYLCGLPQMIEDIEKILTTKGVPTKHIYKEKYTSPGKSKQK